MSYAALYGQKVELMEVSRFTASTKLAVGFVLGLVQHGHQDHHPDLVAANWPDFDFFSEIRAHRVIERGRVEGTTTDPGYNVVTRTVEFFILGHLAAVVHLAGRRVDRSATHPTHSEWAVVEAHYARRFQKKPEDWAYGVFGYHPT